MANVPTAFFGPRSKENARRLLALADEIGIDQRLIRTTAGGYLIPDEIEAALVAEAIASQEVEESEIVADLKEAVAAVNAGTEAFRQEQAEGEPEDVVEDADEVPEPQARPAGNASRDAWATYAASAGVTFPEEATRGEIIALVDEKEGSN